MQVEVGNNMNRSGDNNAQLSNAIQMPVSQSAVVRQQQQQSQKQQQQVSLQSKDSSSSSSADSFSVSSDLQKLVGAFGGVKSIDLCKEFMKTIWTAKESSFKLQAFQIINRTNNRSILQKLVEFRLAELLRVWLRDAIKNDFLDFVNIALDVSRKLPLNTEQVKDIGKVVKVSLSKHENSVIRDKAQDLLSYWLSVAAKSSSSSQTLQSQQLEEQQLSGGIVRGEGKASQSKVSVSTTSPSAALASPNSPTDVKSKVASAKYNDVDIFNTLDILEPRKKPKLMSGNVPESKSVGVKDVNQSAGSSTAQQQSSSLSQTGSNAQKSAVPAVPQKPKKTVRWKPDSQLCTIHEIERIDYYGGKAAQSSLKDMDKSEGSAIKRGFVDDGGDSSAPQGGDIKLNSGEQVTSQMGNNSVQAASGVDVSSLLTTITGNSQFKDILSQFIPPSSSQSSQNQQATAAVQPQAMQPQYLQSMPHLQGSQIYNGNPPGPQHVQQQYPNVAAASTNVYGYQYPQVGQYNQFGNGLGAQPFVMQQQQMLQQQPQQQQTQQMMYQQNYHHHHQPNQQPQSQQSVDQAAFQLPPELMQNLTTILQTVGTVTDGQKSTSGVVNAQSGQQQQHYHHQKRRDGKAQSGHKNKNAKKQKQQQQQ
ncbi:hypothetical protein MP228_010189 [Amoeboaphelidium protococcarum]|nr:hypothetical protein MP228_010189 [Amoeboaphelidium protococcarum]